MVKRKKSWKLLLPTLDGSLACAGLTGKSDGGHEAGSGWNHFELEDSKISTFPYLK